MPYKRTPQGRYILPYSLSFTAVIPVSFATAGIEAAISVYVK